MNNFYNIMLKAISDYKAIIRKTMPATKCTAKMRELEIKRTSIKNIDEIGLYKIGLKIIHELKKDVKASEDKKSSNSYNGAEEFLQYLENVFSKYTTENDKVVHVGQKSSCALISAIQLVSTAKGKLTKEMVSQIKQYSEIVITYGNEEQKQMLIEVISSNNVHSLQKN